MDKTRMLKSYGHKCTLTTQQLEEKFYIQYPEARCLFLKLWYCFRKMFLIRDFNMRATKFCRSEYKLYKQRKYHLQKAPNIIHPLSPFRKWWEIFMVVISLTYLVFFPFAVAFSLLPNVSSISQWKDVPRTVLDVICIMDILVNFRTGFYTVSRELNLNAKDIAKKYFKNYFLFDLISSIPILHLHANITLHQSSPFRFYGHLALGTLKFLRVFPCFHYMSNLAKMMHFQMYSTRIFLTIVISILTFHWISCISIIVGVLSIHIYYPNLPEKESWMTTDNLWNSSTEMIYSIAFYRTTCIISYAEYNLIADNTLADQILVCIIWITAKLLYLLLAALFVQLTRSISSSETKYKEMLSQLLQYMHHKQLSPYTQNRLISYYEFRFQKIFYREHEIFNTVSGPIHVELLMLKCIKLVQNVPFFKDLPQSVMLKIVMALELEIFLIDDVIFKAHTKKTCMYFIVIGTVAIYSKNGVEVYHLHDGEYFGDIGLVLSSKVSTAVAIEPCELYRLDTSRFITIMQPYPELLQSIEQKALERLELVIDANNKYLHFQRESRKNIHRLTYSEKSHYSTQSNFLQK